MTLLYKNGYGQEVEWWEGLLGLGLPLLIAFLLIVFFLPRLMRPDLFKEERKKDEDEQR